MFYSESILNRSVKSFLLALSLLISGLQAGQPPALPSSAAGTSVIQELQQFKRAQPLPLPGLAGQAVISGGLGLWVGREIGKQLLVRPAVLALAGKAIQGLNMSDLFIPTDIAYVCGGLGGIGTAAFVFHRFRILQAIGHQNAQNQNAAVQVAAGLSQSVRTLQEGQHTMRQALELQQTGMQNLQTGQDNLEQQINLRARETVQALANLAASQEQRFAAADQARAADTQTLQQQAARNHQATETRFTTLDEAHRLQLEQQRRTQELLNQLTDNLAPLIALAVQTQQRALPAHEDAAAAAEVRPRRSIEFQPGVVLRTQQRGRGLADILDNEVYDNDDLQ